MQAALFTYLRLLALLHRDRDRPPLVRVPYGWEATSPVYAPKVSGPKGKLEGGARHAKERKLAETAESGEVDEGVVGD